jgi:hypothetical protein
MQISTQKAILWLSGLVAIETAIGGGTINLTNAVPASWIPTIAAWCNILAFVGSSIVATLAGKSVYGASAGASSSSTSAAKVVALFAVLILGALMLPTQSFAAAAPVTTDPVSTLMAQIGSVKADIVAGVVADIQAADADASAVSSTTNQMNDPIAHACYPALVKFLQSLPAATPLNGKFVGVQLFQKKRDFIAQLQAGLPVYLKLGCAPLLGDEVATFTKTMLLVGVKIVPAGLTAMFPALAPITLPALALTP